MEQTFISFKATSEMLLISLHFMEMVPTVVFNLSTVVIKHSESAVQVCEWENMVSFDGQKRLEKDNINAAQISVLLWTINPKCLLVFYLSAPSPSVGQHLFVVFPPCTSLSPSGRPDSSLSSAWCPHSLPPSLKSQTAAPFSLRHHHR